VQQVKVPRTRKEAAPRNVAAKALRQGQFQPKVEKDPKAYTRKRKHKEAPPPDTGESEAGDMQ
jgi:hypothetical protein